MSIVEALRRDAWCVTREKSQGVITKSEGTNLLGATAKRYDGVPWRGKTEEQLGADGGAGGASLSPSVLRRPRTRDCRVPNATVPTGSNFDFCPSSNLPVDPPSRPPLEHHLPNEQSGFVLEATLELRNKLIQPQQRTSLRHSTRGRRIEPMEPGGADTVRAFVAHTSNVRPG